MNSVSINNKSSFLHLIQIKNKTKNEKNKHFT